MNIEIGHYHLVCGTQPVHIKLKFLDVKSDNEAFKDCILLTRIFKGFFLMEAFTTKSISLGNL